tara:strand:+ start:3819 stop:4187 length:369 start_codon:yes stop_codon:yes gene_type:complete
MGDTSAAFGLVVSFLEVLILSIFSNLRDSVFDFYVDYVVAGEKYVVHCRIISSVKNVEFPDFESCDMLTCVSASRSGSDSLQPESWKELLVEHKKEAHFWDKALDTFVMLQISMLTIKPIEA